MRCVVFNLNRYDTGSLLEMDIIGSKLQKAKLTFRAASTGRRRPAVFPIGSGVSAGKAKQLVNG